MRNWTIYYKKKYESLLRKNVMLNRENKDLRVRLINRELSKEFLARVGHRSEAFLEYQKEIQRRKRRYKKNIIDFVESKGRVRTGEICNNLKIPSRTIRRYLNELYKTGLLERKQKVKGRGQTFIWNVSKA